MNDMKVYPIGKIENEHNKVKIILDPSYKKGLTGLSGYSHVQVLWWMDRCDNPDERGTLVEKKPYIPSVDRIEYPATPEWCSHWPNSYEESSNFDWASEFNF